MKNSRDPCLGRRRGNEWTKVSHGLYRPSSDLAGPRQDLEAWQLVLPPSGAFTHLSAAREYGWWLPPLPEDLPVFVSMAKRESRPKRAGLRISRQLQEPPSTFHDGLCLADPAETLLACAQDLQLLDMVVLTDAALHLEACGLADLEVLSRERRRGAPMLRQTLRHADGRSESAWESMLRMLHVACDVPVEPQFEVYDEQGTFLARGDLLVKGTRTVHEYDGDEHLMKGRHRKDLGRDRRLSNDHWLRRGYTSHEVLKQAIGILRDCDASLGRPRRPDRIRAWHAWLLDSMFTPSGMQRFRRRVGLDESSTREKLVREPCGA